jgi:hypothetical protein
MERKIDRFSGEDYRDDKDFAWLGERLRSERLGSLTSKECAKIVKIEFAFDNS